MKTNFSFFFFGTEWNDKIVALEKTRGFHFRLIKTNFLSSFRTGRNNKIIPVQKTTWIPFPFNQNQLFVFILVQCRNDKIFALENMT